MIFVQFEIYSSEACGASILKLMKRKSSKTLIKQAVIANLAPFQKYIKALQDRIKHIAPPRPNFRFLGAGDQHLATESRKSIH